MKNIQRLTLLFAFFSTLLASLNATNNLFDTYLTSLKDGEWHDGQLDFAIRKKRIALEQGEQLLRDCKLLPDSDQASLYFEPLAEPLLNFIKELGSSTIFGERALTEWLSNPQGLTDEQKQLIAAFAAHNNASLRERLKDFNNQAEYIFLNNIIPQWIVYARANKIGSARSWFATLSNLAVSTISSYYLFYPITSTVAQHTTNFIGFAAGTVGGSIIPSFIYNKFFNWFSSKFLGYDWYSYMMAQSLEPPLNQFYTELKTLVDSFHELTKIKMPDSLPKTMRGLRVVGRALYALGEIDATLTLAQALQNGSIKPVTIDSNKNLKDGIESLWMATGNNAATWSQNDTTLLDLSTSDQALNFMKNLILASTLDITTTDTASSLPHIDMTRVALQSTSYYYLNKKAESLTALKIIES